MTTQQQGLALGKLRGMRRMATAQGHFAMVALDQRPPILNLIAAKRGITQDQVAFADMVAVKRILVECLGSHASAMLFDPNYAMTAGIAALPARTGLVVTLEDHRVRDTPGGRFTHSIKDWSVEKIKLAGGDGVKVLAYYRPDAAPDVLAHQHAYVREIGAQCRHWDIPLVFELLVYPFLHSDKHTADYIESPEKLPELVIDSVREFAKPEYGVDLFKLESPLPGATLPEPDGSAQHQAAQAWFNQMGAVCQQAGIPWVMLSAGVTSAQFLRVMRYAYAAGAHGFLAGRSVWWKSLQNFPDMDKFAAQLKVDGAATLQELAQLTLQAGHAWQPDYSRLNAIAREGEFCAAYR